MIISQGDTTIDMDAILRQTLTDLEVQADKVETVVREFEHRLTNAMMVAATTVTSHAPEGDSQ